MPRRNLGPPLSPRRAHHLGTPLGNPDHHVVQQIRQPVAAPRLAGLRVIGMRHCHAFRRVRIETKPSRRRDAAIQMIREGHYTDAAHRLRRDVTRDLLQHARRAEVYRLTLRVAPGVDRRHHVTRHAFVQPRGDLPLREHARASALMQHGDADDGRRVRGDLVDAGILRRGATLAGGSGVDRGCGV